MANPSIVKDGVTYTFADGQVDVVKTLKQGNLDETSMPGNDSDDTFIVDYNGVIKTFTLTGTLFDVTSSLTSTGTVTTVEQQIDWLMGLITGAQDGYTFNTTYQTNKTVYCRKFDISENTGTILQVPFTLEFVEGT